MPTCSCSCACWRFWHHHSKPRASKWILTKKQWFFFLKSKKAEYMKYFRTSRLSPGSCVSSWSYIAWVSGFLFLCFFPRGILRLRDTSVKFLFTKKPRVLVLKKLALQSNFWPSIEWFYGTAIPISPQFYSFRSVLNILKVRKAVFFLDER